MLDQNYVTLANSGLSHEAAGPSTSSSTAMSAVTSAPRYLNDAFEQLRSSVFTRVTQTQGLTKTFFPETPFSYQTGARVFIQCAPNEEPTSVVVPDRMVRILELLFLTSAQVANYVQTPANILFRHMVDIAQMIGSVLKKPSSGMTDINKQMIQEFNQAITMIIGKIIDKLKEIAKQTFTRYHYYALSDTTGQYIYADFRRRGFVIYACSLDAPTFSPENQFIHYLALLDYIINNSVMFLAGITEPTFIEALVYIGVDINKVQTFAVKTVLNVGEEYEDRERGVLTQMQQFIASDAAPKALPAAYEFTALSMAILFSNQEGVNHLLAAGADPNKPAGLFSPLFALAKRSGPLHRVVPVGERGSLEYVHNSHKVALFEALYQAGVRGEEELLTRAASARYKAESQQPEISSDADARQAEALAWAREHEYEAMKAYATRVTKQGTSVKAFTLMGTSANLYSGHGAEQPAAQTHEKSSDCRLQ